MNVHTETEYQLLQSYQTRRRSTRTSIVHIHMRTNTIQTCRQDIGRQRIIGNHQRHNHHSSDRGIPEDKTQTQTNTHIDRNRTTETNKKMLISVINKNIQKEERIVLLVSFTSCRVAHI